MLILLSPAKTLDTQRADQPGTQPRLLSHSQQLVDELRGKSSAEIGALMKISDKLADLNYRRFQEYATPFTDDNATPAGYAFQGDVYQDLEYAKLNGRQRQFANRYIRILSGLYGVLRPSDLMQAYRLEMGTRLKNARGKNLYEFWGNEITDLLNADIRETESSVVLNLASNEYFKSIQAEALSVPVLKVDFKELRKGAYKILTFNAKKARGRMAGLVAMEGITEPEKLKDLVVNDYVYNDDLSENGHWIWTKE